MKILMIDNYDSFTYNLVQLIRDYTQHHVEIFRNDEIQLDDVSRYDKIILSPGPGIPEEAGLLCELIRQYKDSKHIFGVCLGMQAIGEVFGGRLINIEKPLHGVATPIHHTNSLLFNGIPATFHAGRYHSWVIDPAFIPPTLKVTATDDDGMVMAIEHATLPVFAVQFHPESILTEYGKEIILNFINVPL